MTPTTTKPTALTLTDPATIRRLAALESGERAEVRVVMKEQIERDGVWWKLELYKPRRFTLKTNMPEEITKALGALIHTRRNPFGAPGTRLWVRETWGLAWNEHGHQCLCYRADDEHVEPQMMRLWRHNNGDGFWVQHETEFPAWEPENWRSPAIMPRWASRIHLTTIDCRVERVQKVSWDEMVSFIESKGWDVANESETDEEDWMAYWDHRNEQEPIFDSSCACVEEVFGAHWDAAHPNPKERWGVNPWVWVATLERGEG